MALSKTGVPITPVTGRGRPLVARARHAGGNGWRSLLFLLPVALYIALVFAFPIYHNTYVSLHEYTLKSLITGEADFVGLRNFADAFSDSRFRLALRNTVIFTVVSLVMQYAIGLLLALFFQGRFPLSRTLRSLLILPWLTPPHCERSRVALAVCRERVHQPGLDDGRAWTQRMADPADVCFCCDPGGQHLDRGVV